MCGAMGLPRINRFNGILNPHNLQFLLRQLRNLLIQAVIFNYPLPVMIQIQCLKPEPFKRQIAVPIRQLTHLNQPKIMFGMTERQRLNQSVGKSLPKGWQNLQLHRLPSLTINLRKVFQYPITMPTIYQKAAPIPRQLPHRTA